MTYSNVKKAVRDFITTATKPYSFDDVYSSVSVKIGKQEASNGRDLSFYVQIALDDIKSEETNVDKPNTDLYL